MEASPTAAEVVLPLRPSSPEGGAFPDPLEEFNLQLEDIIKTFGSAAAALDSQEKMEAEMERKAEAGSDIAGAVEAEVAVISQSLSPFPSPQDKLDHLLRRHAELAALRRRDQQQLRATQAESRSSVAARSRLETLCRELQQHHGRLQEETLRRCRQDEERRVEMAAHFQAKLTEIQEQIEQHSARNDKLCQENANLTGKLESIVAQCELREESLEKINKRRDLQQQLTEAKLQQADALLADAQEKHKREKEYLLREAIDKTKKCFAMKEQELAMKKKLTLYAQKFDEFQETLAKSNEIYGRFKKEMNNMSDKMKKMEKESNVWRSRFENCNKALTDMIQERTERSQEYDLFVLKIQRLEKLCRALQEERSVLYGKIKEVRHANANLPSKRSGCDPEGAADGHALDHAEVLSAEEVREIQGEDPVLTDDMNRLREEQAKLQEFAASLLATPSDEEEEDKAEVEPEEDAVALAFNQFKAKVPAKEDEASGPEEEVPLTSEQDSSEGGAVRSQVDLTEVQRVSQPPAEPMPEQVQNDPPADPEPQATEAEVRGRASQGEPVAPATEEEVPARSGPQADEAPSASESTPLSENPPPPASDPNRKQPAKKKKKRSAKNAS